MRRAVVKGVGVAAGLAALALGATAAGVEVQTRMLRRSLRQLDRGCDDFFALRTAGTTVRTPDGVELHAEVDEPDDPGEELTLVWVHGYALSLDNWYFQRRHFVGRIRSVFYDQRSHGTSSRSDPERARIAQLGADLEQILEDVVGDRPVILIGHSMGGMSIMELARQRPDWFGHAARVRGVALLNTSSGAMQRHSVVPGIPGAVFSRLTPPLLTTLNLLPNLVALARRRGTDVGYVFTKRFSFGNREVAANKVEFMNEMLAQTPLEVVADFYPAFAELDERDAFFALARTDLLLVGGTADAITPYPHTETISRALPGARLLRLSGVGHMSMIEREDEVNAAIERLIADVRSR